MAKNQSIHRVVHKIFLENPYSLFTTKELVDILRNKYNIKTKKEIITMILTRLYRTEQVYRTPTQLTGGYSYSLRNKEQLNLIYRNYLLPSTFDNKKGLVNQILKNHFDDLQTNFLLDLHKIKEFAFIKKYSFNYFKDIKNQKFLTLLIGFTMCDGHINKKANKTSFFFRREKDAKLFIKDFNKIFPLERFRIAKAGTGNSYLIEVSKGAPISKLLHFLGSPKGNKVFQPFLVPGWIYYGPDEIKEVFLSTIIGNEGSAPSKSRWRIQFVLSKCEEYIPNLLDFLNQIRAMLYHFGITTSHIQLRKQKDRQFHGRFYIKGKENLRKFYNEFCFLYASEKQEVLEDLISRDASGECNTL